MKDNPLVVILAIVIAIACIVGMPKLFIDTEYFKLNPLAPQSTLSAGDAAANATMVARQQLAEIEAGAARAEAQATAQAAAAWATEQSIIADQAHLNSAATRQAEKVAQATRATAQAIQVTAEHKMFVATATSAAESTRVAGTAEAVSVTEAAMAQFTAIAATATRQVEVQDVTATADSIRATETRQAIERAEKEEDQEYTQQVWKGRGATAFSAVIVMVLMLITSLLLYPSLKCAEQCVKRLPGTWRAVLFFTLRFWEKYKRRKECKTKVTPSQP